MVNLESGKLTVDLHALAEYFGGEVDIAHENGVVVFTKRHNPVTTLDKLVEQERANRRSSR